MSTLATPLPSPLAQPPKPKNWLQRHWLMAIIGGCFMLMLFFAGFIVAVFAVIQSSFKSDYAYAQGLARAQSNPQVIEKFGQPIRPGWFSSGNIQINGPSGSADISIPISGPKAKGTIYSVAKKTAGKWHFETLEVEVEGQPERINLLATPAPAS